MKLALTTVLATLVSSSETAESAEIVEAVSTAAPVAEAAQLANTDIPTWFVVVLGMAIVFIGLICLIALISFMGVIMKKVNAKHEAETEAAAPAAVSAAADIPNRGELVAAVSVALAEELGKDVKAIRIHSIERV